MENAITYSDVLVLNRNPVDLRIKMVQTAQQYGVSYAARAFNTTRKSVRKWLKRYLEDRSIKSLENHTKAPINPHCLLPEEIRKLIVKFRQTHPSLGYPYLLGFLQKQNVPTDQIPSKQTAYAIWKKHNLIKKRTRKWKRKALVCQWKKKLRPFEHIQIDVKHLCDIPNYLKQHYKTGAKLPMFEYTARDIKTGGLFVSLADEQSLINSSIFAEALLQHLEDHKVYPRKIQTDNGSQFVNTKDALKKTLFTDLIQQRGIEHKRIPPGATTYQSDVERAHGLIEYEFYDTIKTTNRANLCRKLQTYQWLFNTQRHNSYKESKTPLQIATEHTPTENLDPQLFNFPVLILDSLLSIFIKGGYHVPLPDSPFSIDILIGNGYILFGNYQEFVSNHEKFLDK